MKPLSLFNIQNRWQDDSRTVAEVAASVTKWLDAVQSLVIGPGLSRDDKIQVSHSHSFSAILAKQSCICCSKSKSDLNFSGLGNSGISIRRSKKEENAHCY
jgi:hypothetical protein